MSILENPDPKWVKLTPPDCPACSDTGKVSYGWFTCAGKYVYQEWDCKTCSAGGESRCG